MKTVLVILSLFGASTTVAQSTSLVEINKITDQFYRIVCQYGNTSPNTLAFVGNDGILLVDSGLLQTGKELKSELENLGNGKLSLIINSHLHPDHIGGNSLLYKHNIPIITHNNTRERLKGFYGQIRNVPKESLPTITFEDSLTLFFNDEEIKLLYFPGHTDGDIIVHFSESKIVFMGDMLLTNGFPSVEINVGGDIKQYLKSLKKIITQFTEDTKFIAGHGRDYTLEEMKQYYEMAKNTAEAIRLGINAGKDINTMREEKILHKWDIDVENGAATADYWIGAVAGSLTNGNTKISIAEPLLTVLMQSNALDAVNHYKSLKKNKYNNYDFNENALNILGYYLLGKDRVNEAIVIFKLNVEEYPEAFNVYDSLGEAYMINGNKIRAIKNYEKSLELNPDNLNAVEMLKKLNIN